MPSTQGNSNMVANSPSYSAYGTSAQQNGNMFTNSPSYSAYGSSNMPSTQGNSNMVANSPSYSAYGTSNIPSTQQTVSSGSNMVPNQPSYSASGAPAAGQQSTTNTFAGIQGSPFTQQNQNIVANTYRGGFSRRNFAESSPSNAAPVDKSELRDNNISKRESLPISSIRYVLDSGKLKVQHDAEFNCKLPFEYVDEDWVCEESSIRAIQLDEYDCWEETSRENIECDDDPSVFLVDEDDLTPVKPSAVANVASAQVPEQPAVQPAAQATVQPQAQQSAPVLVGYVQNPPAASVPSTQNTFQNPQQPVGVYAVDPNAHLSNPLANLVPLSNANGLPNNNNMSLSSVPPTDSRINLYSSYSGRSVVPNTFQLVTSVLAVVITLLL